MLLSDRWQLKYNFKHGNIRFIVFLKLYYFTVVTDKLFIKERTVLKRIHKYIELLFKLID